MAQRPSSAVHLGFVLALTVAASPVAAESLGGPNWTDVPHSHIDPQIAAGPNRVLITLYDRVYYYDKSGKQITHVKDNPSKPALVSGLEELFDPIRDDADGHLALPPGTTCDRTHRDEPSYVRRAKGPDRTVSNYCLDRFGYDARVLFDEYRERFVVVAVAINTGAKCKFNPGESNYFARRNKILVAYSASSDPTDGTGWHLKWFDAAPGESCTTQKCRDDAGYLPGTASDFPVVAVVKDYLLVSINNQAHEKLDGDTCPPCSGAKCDPEKYGYEDDYLPLPSTVHVWSTKGLASGKFDEKTCDGLCSWVYNNGDIRGAVNLPLTGSPTLGQGHGEPFLGSAFFAEKDGADGLNIWRFSIAGVKTKPPLVRTRVTLPAFGPFGLPNSYGNGKHAPLLVNSTSALVQRGDHLFYADVGTKPQSLGAGIRLVGLQGNVLGLFTLGRNAIFGEPGQGYGSPALEVNSNNDMILAYRKVGESAAPGFGARFLVWKSGTSTPPGGHTLADDEFDLPCPDKKCEEVQGDHDTAGISLAPQGRVYVMQPFLDKRTKDWAYAVNFVVP